MDSKSYICGRESKNSTTAAVVGVVGAALEVGTLFLGSMLKIFRIGNFLNFHKRHKIAKN